MMPSRLLAIGLAFMCLAGNIQPARLAARAPLRQPRPSPRPSQSMFQSKPGTPHAIEFLITYKSVKPSGGGPARNVSVALIDPRAGGPLRVTDRAGRAVTARISAEVSYDP